MTTNDIEDFTKLLQVIKERGLTPTTVRCGHVSVSFAPPPPPAPTEEDKKRREQELQKSRDAKRPFPTFQEIHDKSVAEAKLESELS